MWLRKKILILYILSATTVILLLGVLHNLIPDNNNASFNYNFDNFNNANASKLYLVPNVVHYVIFNKTSINFVAFLSLLSVIKNHNPDKLIIHTDAPQLSGPYWDKIINVETNTTLILFPLQQPTHVYGQKLSSVYHATDVARIQILRRYGGIYFDSDVLVLNKLDPLRHYEMAVGLPKGDYMGTQVLVANKNARFLKLWLEGYKKYHPRDWYYNAGIVPTKILQDFPFLAHKEETKFGVQNVLDKLHTNYKWNEWKSFYTLHLLSRHEPSPHNLDEIKVQNLNTNFGKIARMILSK